MIAYKQAILPGDSGSDVEAVKNTLRRLGIKGSGAMNMSDRAGPAFVTALKVAQRRFEVPVDGEVRQGHARVSVAPHFDSADEALYQKARAPQAAASAGPVRRRGGRGEAAARAAGAGEVPRRQPRRSVRHQAAAAGHAVHSPSGQMVHIDARVLQVIIHLIGLGHTIGTYAICSDHHDDGPHGTPGAGPSTSRPSTGTPSRRASSRAQVLAIDKALHHAGPLKPRQLITGGCGNVRDAADLGALHSGRGLFYGARSNPRPLQPHPRRLLGLHGLLERSPGLGPRPCRSGDEARGPVWKRLRAATPFGP